MSIFTAKNDRRKMAKAEALAEPDGAQRYKNARTMRRFGTDRRNGGFGNLSAEAYNERVFGTTGKPRKVKADDNG